MIYSTGSTTTWIFSRLDIESVARRSGYSKWHLQRSKEHTGYRLAGYIRGKAAKIG
jgi:AraC family transcriptional activator of mar-sox-rob regulon